MPKHDDMKIHVHFISRVKDVLKLLSGLDRATILVMRDHQQLNIFSAELKND